MFDEVTNNIYTFSSLLTRWRFTRRNIFNNLLINIINVFSFKDYSILYKKTGFYCLKCWKLEKFNKILAFQKTSLWFSRTYLQILVTVNNYLSFNLIIVV